MRSASCIGASVRFGLIKSATFHGSFLISILVCLGGAVDGDIEVTVGTDGANWNSLVRPALEKCMSFFQIHFCTYEKIPR